MLRFPQVMGVLEQGLRAAALRHSVIAHNVANANTPQFKALAVQFEDDLAAALAGGGDLPLAQTDRRHLVGGAGGNPEQVAPRVVRAADRVQRLDGNSVDVEAEMGRLAANQLYHSGLVRQLSDEFRRLRLAITGGRR